MKHPAKISHIAFLVKSVEQAASVPELTPFFKGPAETWEGEGTLEIYVGPPGATARLLLMEAVKDGAYRRALQKRGPGLHHIAIDVLDLENFVADLSGSGWLLHPQSLRTIKKSKTAYLARPGIPTLIEVQEREQFPEGLQFIETVELPWPNEAMRTVNCLQVRDLQQSFDGEMWLKIGAHRVPASAILG